MSWAKAENKAISKQIDAVAGIEAPYGAKVTINADSPFAGNQEMLAKIAAAVEAGSNKIRLKKTEKGFAILVATKDGSFTNVYAYLKVYKKRGGNGKSKKDLKAEDIDL